MSATKTPESHVDVLIIGAGPAGLMMATWMAHLGIKTRIIDKRNSKVFCGQADGLQCRTLEIFDSFGFGDRAWKEANHMLEVCMWNPGPDGIIRRSDRIADTIPGVCKSRFHEVVLHQGRIERFFLDNIKKYSQDGLQVERAVLPESLDINLSLLKDASAYPVTMTLRHLSDEEATPPKVADASKVANGLFRSNLTQDDTSALIEKAKDNNGETETVHAKYVVGCDGAHSWTRKQLGFEMIGEASDLIWGVMDIIPITDFPDIRMRCAIHSTDSGSLMVIPRENKLVRLYVQLKEVTPDETGRADRSKITPDYIFAAAQKILQPFKIDYKYCDWWTAYQIGQRIGTSFDAHQRVFLAGDAVHTHSPKAGQGMNVSIHDTFNLGWKIGLVVKGIAKRDILTTYQSERQKVAEDLIEFDHRFSRLFSGRPARDVMDSEGVSMEEFKSAFEKGNLFASGLSVDYGPSHLVAKDTPQGKVVGKQQLATEIPLGMRLTSHKVLNQTDARSWHVQERLKSDGRFRIILFAGDVLVTKQRERIDAFCAFLDSPESFLRRATPPAEKIDSVIEILTIHSSKREDTDWRTDFPDILHPFDPNLGWDYDKIYVDDKSYHDGHGNAYTNYGISKSTGCVVVTRPDHYVGWIGELEDTGDLQAYFENCLELRSATDV